MYAQNYLDFVKQSFSIVHFDKVSDILTSMEELYTTKLSAGSFVTSLVNEDWSRAIQTADQINIMYLKIYQGFIWFLKDPDKDKSCSIPDSVSNFVLLAKSNYRSKDGRIKKGVEMYGRFYAPKNDC